MLSLLAAAGCDGRGDAPEPRSIFVTEDPYARQVEGRVLRGTEIVPGANVKLDPAGDFAAYDRLAAAGTAGYQTSTDLGGKYHISNGPFFYDLSIRKDREVVVFRSLAVRYFEAPLGADAPLRGFTAKIAASTDTPPAAGNAVAYFVSGPAARAVTVDGSSLVASFRSFDATITLQAVEYVASKGLGTARRWGRTDVAVTDGGAAAAVVIMNPIDLANDSSDTVFEPVVPPGFTLTTLDVVLDFGARTSAQLVAHVLPGAAWHVEVARAARYFVRAIATKDGAISDSGLQYFNPFAPKTTILLPRVVKESSFDPAAGLSAAADNTVCEITPSLAAKPACLSVVEHVLVPHSPTCTALRIATTDRVTALPDVTPLGVPRVSGRYTWTVQQFPTLPRIDRLSGEDVRVVTPVSATAPRVIDLP
ncbi:hypothetical protein BH11MYX4_BH11MYX4_38080 [soil metagenome]